MHWLNWPTEAGQVVIVLVLLMDIAINRADVRRLDAERRVALKTLAARIDAVEKKE